MKQIRNRYRYSAILLKQLVKTDFKLRYQNSLLGYLWSLLRPLALFVIMYFVFVKLIKVNYGVPDSAVYLLMGLVVWNYFGEVTSGSVGAIVGRGDLLRKLNFPRYTVVLAGSFSALINLLINFVVVGIFMVVSHVHVQDIIIWAPLIVIELFVFSVGVAFFLSALYVKFRDVNYIWEVVMQAAFYGTPIFYSLISIPAKYDIAKKIIMVNPLAQIIQDMRHVVVTDKSLTIASVYGSRWARLIPILITIFIAVLSAIYFRRRSKYFAEEI